MSRAIVIGGGLNGLTAATLLAKAGREVTLVEGSDHLGGMAAGGTPQAPRMAHLLYNLNPVVLKDIGVDGFETVDLPTVALDPGGRHVVVRGTQATLADGTPHPDADRFGLLTTRLIRHGALLRQMAEAPPPGHGAGGPGSWLRLARLGLGVKRMGRSEMRQFLKTLLSNAHDLILDEIPDGPLAGLLASDAVRGAAQGPRAPGTVFSLIYRYGHGGGAQWPLGGMGMVTERFAETARRAGVTIKTGQTATAITHADDRITGLSLGDDHLTADTVLTSSGALAAAQMVGLDEFDIEATRRLRQIRAKGTVAKINLTLARAPAIPGLPDDLRAARMVLSGGSAEVEHAFDASKYGEISDAPVIEMILPQLCDPTLPQDGPVAASLVVQYTPHDLKGGWSDAARDALLQRVLARLAAVIPDLPDLVEAAEVITPDKIAAETHAPGGHWHHAEMALDQLLSTRPAAGIGGYHMGPKGLWLCGASAHPGGDLMGLAGRNAARAVLEDRT